MSKILNKTKKIKTELITSGLVMTMMLLLYIINGIAPFGNRTILTSDLFHQYAVFIAELCDKFANGESIIYSIQKRIYKKSGLKFIISDIPLALRWPIYYYVICQKV